MSRVLRERKQELGTTGDAYRVETALKGIQKADRRAYQREYMKPDCTSQLFDLEMQVQTERPTPSGTSSINIRIAVRGHTHFKK